MNTLTLHPSGKTHDGHPRYEVRRSGVAVGFIEGHNPSFERSSPGKRYVNARWRSKRRYWRAVGTNNHTISQANETRSRALRAFEP